MEKEARNFIFLKIEYKSTSNNSKNARVERHTWTKAEKQYIALRDLSINYQLINYVSNLGNSV